jgi:hypothetical protein
MTPGIAALGPEAVERIVKTIAVFDDFCHANDPHEEHDFGAFEADADQHDKQPSEIRRFTSQRGVKPGKSSCLGSRCAITFFSI